MSSPQNRKDRAGIPAVDPVLAAVTERYAVAVTPAVMETINPADPADPVARQYLPSVAEAVTTPEELADPIGDNRYMPVRGIVHRYPDRVLLKPVHVCAVYCRFCFRREMVGPGKDTALSAAELDAAITYIRNAPQVWEVILTGGDPLVLSPRRLKDLMARLNDIPHVKVIRFHTRVPVADPARMTDEVIAALDSDKAVYVVFHANHANELTDRVADVARRMTRAGIVLLSQSTLLRGVNDDAAVLEGLFRRLTEIRVKPYYLHHPDLAPGTSHFRMKLAVGRKLMQSLLGRLSGIARPSYVLDIPGGFGKVPVTSDHVTESGDDVYVTDSHGVAHRYPDGK